LLDGGVVAEEEEEFGKVEMVGIFFVERSGDFEATRMERSGSGRLRDPTPQCWPHTGR